MYNRNKFKRWMEPDPVTRVKDCQGKFVTDYEELEDEMSIKQMRLFNEYRSWDASKGIRWLFGFSNYINQNANKKVKTALVTQSYTFGQIIYVDFFGTYGAEMTYDHPAIVLYSLPNGVIIAPITSNPDTYDNAVNKKVSYAKYLIPLPQRNHKFGNMPKNSTIQLNQLRFIDKTRILEVFKSPHAGLGGELKPNKIKDAEKIKEIKGTLVSMFGKNYLYNEFVKKSTYELLEVKAADLEKEVTVLEVKNADLEKVVFNLTSMYEAVTETLEVKDVEIATLKAEIERLKGITSDI